jgi:hypothetical protein
VHGDARALEPVPIGINLVPPALLESARRKEQLFYWVLSFITLGLIGASIVPGLTAKQKLVLERIQTVKKYVQAYDPEIAENPGKKSVHEAALQAARNEVAARQNQLNLLASAYTSCNWWINFLRFLNDARPQGGKVWFSSVESTAINPGGTDPKRGMAGAPGFPGLVAAKGAGGIPKQNGLKILGYASDPDSLTQFIAQLRESRVAQGPGEECRVVAALGHRGGRRVFRGCRQQDRGCERN